ncbi:MAG: twin-arginine translocase TatA/TatE family subunit [Lentisphaerae bacterium]|nr:twin-arginine translocase TatA/TatE family subunit [Lentisphaerota bacterium]
MAFLQNMGPTEILLILLVVLLLFGAKRLPDLARALGRSLNEFRKGREEGAGKRPDEKTGAAAKKPEDKSEGGDEAGRAQDA